MNEKLKLFLRSLSLVFISIIALFFSALPLEAEDNPNQPISASQSSEKTIINFGFSTNMYSDVDLKDARLASEYWLNLMLWDKEHYRVKVVIFPDSDAILNYIRTQDIGIVALTSLEYLELKDKASLEPALVGVYHDGKHTQKYILLVQKGGNIKGLKDLKEKKIITDSGKNGFTEHFWLETLLLKENLPEIKDFFGSIEEAQKPSQAVLPVFFGKADAAIVSQGAYDTIVELNPQIGSELISLNNSQDLLPSLVCFTKNLNEYLRNNTMDSASKLHNEPEAKQALVLFHIDRLIPFEASYVDGIVALVKEHDELKQNKNKQNEKK